jgi:membrane fusion protein, multidrug efflux system
MIHRLDGPVAETRPRARHSTGSWLVLVLLLVGLVSLNGGCGLGKAKGSDSSGGAPGAGGPPKMPPTPVEASTVTAMNLTDHFEAVGSLQAVDAITVVSEIDAAIVGLPFQEGDWIDRGTVVARLDDAQLTAEFDRAAALRDQSKSRFERVRSIVEQKAAAQQDLDDAAAALKVTDANLALAQARLSKTRIIAPFSGQIGARRVSVGAFLRAGQPIADLARLDRLRVEFSVPERVLANLRRGAEVRVQTTAYSGYEVTGKIIAIDPMLDPNTRTARVVAEVANPALRFRPGMSANVSADLGTRQNALTVPSEAVFEQGTQSFAFVIKPDSTVTRVPLTLGVRRSDLVEVLQGLQIGARIVRAGHQKLFEGAKVFPVAGASEGNHEAQ